MKHIKTAIKSMGIQAVVIVGLFAVAAWTQGRGELIAPFLAGGFVYSSCWLSTGYKLFSSDSVSPDKAAKSLRIINQLRLILLFGTLLVAMQIGEPFFWAAVGGACSMFVVIMVNAMLFSYRDKDML